MVDFAHDSERQFAKLLDFYDIAWEYEPREFAIEWDDAGEPIKFFRPDFYLPDEDMYIEITTMNQKLVTKKNRKVRLLRELYPDVTLQDLLPARLPESPGQIRARGAGGAGSSRGADPDPGPATWSSTSARTRPTTPPQPAEPER